jgi:hypothetical protein
MPTTQISFKPGTIVWVRNEWVGAVLGQVAHIQSDEPWFQVTNGIQPWMAYPTSALTLAPRYFVGGKWTVKRPNHGSRWDWSQVGHDGRNWRWLKGSPTKNQWHTAQTYTAACAAVELANGHKRIHPAP